MDEQAILQSAYQYIRKEFFPRWDKKCQWLIKCNSKDSREGLCDLENKEIIISVIPESKTDFHLLLIHEICHFVSPKHGSKWQKRMTKATERSDQIGREGLAKAIREEIEFYKNLPEFRLKDVYNAIEDTVWGNRKLSFEKVIWFVASSVGCTPKDLIESAKRAKKVYDRAKLDAIEENIARKN